jgi:hypothetical protein
MATLRYGRLDAGSGAAFYLLLLPARCGDHGCHTQQPRGAVAAPGGYKHAAQPASRFRRLQYLTLQRAAARPIPPAPLAPSSLPPFPSAYVHSVFMLLCWMAAVPPALAVVWESLLQRKRYPQHVPALLGASLLGAGAP